MVDMEWMDLVAKVEVLGGWLFHSVVVVLGNPGPMEVVSLAVLGTLEEAVHEIVLGFSECGSFELWRRLVGDVRRVERLEVEKCPVVLVVAMETMLSILGEDAPPWVVSEVEGIGSSDGHLLVDMETVLGNPATDVDMVDSDLAVSGAAVTWLEVAGNDPVVCLQLISSSQQSTRIW